MQLINLQDASSDHLAALLRGNIQSLSFAESVRDEVLARLIETLPNAAQPQETENLTPNPKEEAAPEPQDSPASDKPEDVPFDTVFLADVLVGRLRDMEKKTRHPLGKSNFNRLATALEVVPALVLISRLEDGLH